MLLLLMRFGSGLAAAGEVLAWVQAHRLLNCGVSDGRIGFSYQDAKGHWSGLDVDFGRAVGAAVCLIASGGAQGYVILPEQISKKPLGSAVKRGGEEGPTLLRWILLATIEAEEQE